MLRLAMALVMASAAPVAADIWTFETPSENIQCSVGEGRGGSDLDCTIIERSGPPARPRPAECRQDWGHSFYMQDRGRVEMRCAPLDRGKGGFDRAEYGVTGKFGGFTCTSSRTGLECRNLDGHGFFLSRRKQSVF